MPSQTIPELIAQVDRIERQVALISEKLGLPYDYPGNAAMPPEVVQLAQAGDKRGALAKYRELTGAGLQEAQAAIEAL
jgi:ribosomal protein L7/L12